MDYKVLTTTHDVTDKVLKLALDCAEESQLTIGQIDWDRTYDDLEILGGYFVAKFGSPADRKIRRHVNTHRDW